MKSSPKGLFRHQLSSASISAAYRVEAFISRGEEWAREILDEAKINPPRGKEREFARKRPQADIVHQALETIHFANRLRHALGIAKRKGPEIEIQSLWAADLMAQFCNAGIIGALTDIEPAIKHGADRLNDLAESRTETNARRHATRSLEWQKWQNEADGIWLRGPSLLKNSVAKLVKKNLGLLESVDLVARRIKKSGKAG